MVESWLIAVWCILPPPSFFANPVRKIPKIPPLVPAVQAFSRLQTWAPSMGTWSLSRNDELRVWPQKGIMRDFRVYMGIWIHDIHDTGWTWLNMYLIVHRSVLLLPVHFNMQALTYFNAPPPCRCRSTVWIQRLNALVSQRLGALELDHGIEDHGSR